MTRFILAVSLLLAIAARGDADSLTAAEIVTKSQQAFYYPGNDMRARVVMDLITDSGKKRSRVLSMLRKNDPKTKNQRYLLYFHEPGDVRRTAFLVWKYPERDDERWIFIPAVNMVRRVAAKDSRSSFVGSDFTYEDISGRDVQADDHSLLREERLAGVDYYVIQSVPKSAMEYSRKLSWIDKTTFLPRREEYFDVQHQLSRLFTADQVEVAGGFPTVVKRTMKAVKTGHRTEVTFQGVTYNNGIDEEIFAERSLQNPPARWIE